MPTPSLKELMAAGAHFGHKKERSHPKAKQFIYTLREGIYIIDLEKTQEALEKALKVTADLAKSGKTILFVGTKPQAADLVKAAAESANMPYIVNRWPGGLLTNFETTTSNLKSLLEKEGKVAGDGYVNLTKKERRVIGDEITKATSTLGGVRNMTKTPDALFVVDVVAESTALKEAYRLGIPVIGMCDTNANPELVDYPIPANDDARKTIEMVVTQIAQTITANRPVAATPAPKVEAPVETAEKPAVAEKTEEVKAEAPATTETPTVVAPAAEEKPKRTRTTKKTEAAA